MIASDRYDRQQRIRGWQQQKLAQARVLVAGAGALGNELIKNLTLIGIGHILVIDFDRVELSNLSRSVLFRAEDIGRPKARVAAEAARRLNPDLELRWIDGDLFADIGLGFYRHADLVISGLDSLAARSQVGLSCALAGVPFLDSGMWALGGEVRWFLPGDGPCFDCTLSDDDRQHASERRSCSGFRMEDEENSTAVMPSTISTTAVVAGLTTQEVVRYLCGWEVRGGEALVYNGLTQTMHTTELPRRPDCPYHQAYEEIVELDAGAAELSAAALLQEAEHEFGEAAFLELGRDFLLEFRCQECRHTETVNKLLGQVTTDRRFCPQCGRLRQSVIVSRLNGAEPYAHRTLDTFGVPPGEVLAAHAGDQVRLYELTGDVERFWTSSHP